MVKNIAQVDSELALKAIANAAPNNPIILDFDETLLLRNSTAEYINNLRPRWLGFILIMLLKLVRPWYWLPQPLGGEKTKDWYLVILPTLLMPWTSLLWQQKAKELAQDYSNTEIITAVDSNPHAKVIIASLGFNFAIAPILKHMSIQYDSLVGCGFWRGAGDRNKGKLNMMQEVLSESELKSAILITDSLDDLPLLEIVEQPCLALWSSAKYINPFQDFWLDRWIRKFKQ